MLRIPPPMAPVINLAARVEPSFVERKASPACFRRSEFFILWRRLSGHIIPGEEMDFFTCPGWRKPAKLFSGGSPSNPKPPAYHLLPVPLKR